MATGDDGDRRRDLALAPTTLGPSDETQAPGKTATVPGRVIAPPTIAGDESMLREGDAVDRYRVEAYLGRGGMGVVYRARDPDLDRVLAIKLVRSRSRGGDRMLREAQAMARLDHPNVVPIFDVGMRGEQVFLVMPFLSGGTLGDWCRAKRRPWHEVVRRYIEAGRGLEAAHKAGLVHRDFKPDNVLIDHNDEVHVADFGLARAQLDGDKADRVVGSGPLGYALTQAGELLGTPAYMAPEQLDGDPVDGRADQFSFCVSLHEGLYGKRPFDVPKGAGIVAIREAMRADKICAVPDDRVVPKSVREAVLRGLRHAPDARWPSLSALLDVLEREVSQRAPAPNRSIAKRPTRGVGLRIAIGVAIAALVAGVVWFAATRGSSGSRDAARTVGAGSGPGIGADNVPLGTPYQARALTFRGDVDLAALSPDGSHVAAMAGADLVLVPIAAGAEMRTLVPKAGDVGSLSWSDDGKRLMFVSPLDAERSAVGIVDVASGAVERLERAVWRNAAFSGPREVASAAANVDSLRITPLDQDLPARRCPLPGEIEWVGDLASGGGAVFVTVAHHDLTLSVLRTDRNCVAPRPVLDHVAPGAIVVDTSGTSVGIMRAVGADTFVEWHTVDGGDVSRSRPLPAEVEHVIGRIADDRAVAITSRRSWQLISLDGGDPVGVSSADAELVLSPDRTRVAVIDSRTEPSALRIVPLASLDGRPAPLATDVLGVAWSPDQTRLAVARDQDGKVELEIVELANNTWTPLPAADVSPTGQLAWLDDRRVAYLRNDHTTFVSIERETNAIGSVLDPSLGWTFDLAVSPSDGTLALQWEQRSVNGVFVIPPGGEPKRVAPGGNVGLAWSPDGKSLWSVDRRLGAIYRHDRTTGNTELVRQISLDRMSAIAMIAPMPDGSLLLQLSRSSDDLVVLE